MVNGQWSMVNGRRSLVNGQWSMVNGHSVVALSAPAPPLQVAQLAEVVGVGVVMMM